MSLLGLGVAGIAIEQAIPLGRVWSFPSKIVIPDFPPITWVTKRNLDLLRHNLVVVDGFSQDWDKEFEKPFRIGSKVRIKLPVRYAVRMPRRCSPSPS